MEVFACLTSLKWMFSSDNAFERNEDAIDERNAENKESGSHFSTGEDSENAQHQSEEHCPGIAHEHAWGREVEQKTRDADAG